MKFTFEDSKTGQKIRLAVRKPDKDARLIIQDEDTKDQLAEIFGADGKLGFRITSRRPDVFVQSMEDEAPIDLQNKIAEQSGDVITDMDALRNWKVEKGVLKVTNPKMKSVIELPIHKPGPLTPKGTHEILGQHMMVFSVAYAMATGQNSMMTGPTATGKTTVYQWLAEMLGWNYVACPIARGTESVHLLGTYTPVGQAQFEWTDGPVATAVRLSKTHPTILVFDEINRIGNLAEFSDVYPALDDTRKLLLRDHRMSDGKTETLDVGQLVFGATANPSDDERADYIGVQDMDPALSRRFPVQPTVDYPPKDVEISALIDRVPGLDTGYARRMVSAAESVRNAPEIRFPMSFSELVAWGRAIPDFGYREAAVIGVVNKAPRDMQSSIMGYLKLNG